MKIRISAFFCKTLICLILFSSQACSSQLAVLATPTPTVTRTLVSTLTPAPAAALAPTITPTATATPTSTQTLTPTITPSPSITPTQAPTATPTYDFPDVTVKVAQAHGRYGPSTGYLHAADLYQGDHATVRGRNQSATWLYVKFDKLDYFCWVAASLVELQGDVILIYPTERKLPQSTLYGPPDDVLAVRDGDKVIVSWDKVSMTEDDDRGYMIEAYVCQDQRYIFVVVATNNTFYEFADGSGCPLPSQGLLYTVEKHGYTHPVTIPWPAP